MATPSSPSITLARRLGDRYEILQPIGRPFGYQQFLAKDTQQERSVVIKLLAIEDNTPTGDVCCFEREIQLLESLSHPTIPRYINAFTLNATDNAIDNATEGQKKEQKRKGLVLVQSHRDGHTLAQQVAKATYCEADIRAIARQLLQGLMYLHSKGFVHRDIKPDNIVIASSPAGSKARSTAKPTARFTEGLAQVSWLNLGTVQYVQAQRNDALVGTYGYMPPEQVGGQATFASDLYSLGATLIYLATGYHLGELPHRPHSGGLRAKFACSTTTLSSSFQQWLNWLIEPYVGDRPKSARQALAALNHLPLSMLKRRILQPTQALMMPVPITGNRNQYQPFFTQIRSVKKLRSLELVVPPVGIKMPQIKRALPPLLMGGLLMALALHLLSLLHFSTAMLSSPSEFFSTLASLAAASLAIMGGLYSYRFFKTGLRLLSTFLFRQIHIQIEADVLLIAYKYWLRSPVYVVNTRRADIYSIGTLPVTDAADADANNGALRVSTHRNRVRTPRDCYKLTVTDGALSQRDLRWLTSLLNDWRSGIAAK